MKDAFKQEIVATPNKNALDAKDEYTPSPEEQSRVEELAKIVGSVTHGSVSVVGGYGLDGLLGRLTRPHDDFDFLVRTKSVEDLVRALQKKGYFPQKREIDDGTVVFKGPFGKVDFATDEELAKWTQIEIAHFFPSATNATLMGHQFRTPDLIGQREIIRIQKERARRQGWAPYPVDKQHNLESVLRELDERQTQMRPPQKAK